MLGDVVVEDGLHAICNMARVSSSIGVCKLGLVVNWWIMWRGKEERKINTCLVSDIGGSQSPGY